MEIVRPGTDCPSLNSWGAAFLSMCHMRKKVLFNLRVEPVLRQSFKAWCAAQGTTMSAEIVSMISAKLGGADSPDCGLKSNRGQSHE